jgi:hypothetical protein
MPKQTSLAPDPAEPVGIPAFPLLVICGHAARDYVSRKTTSNRIRCFIRIAILVVVIFQSPSVSAGNGRRSVAPNASFGSMDGLEAEWHMLQNDTLPSDFPTFQIQVFDNPAAGKIFMCPFLRGTPRYTYLTILDENMTPLYYSRRPESMNDFKLQPNGLMTFFDTRTRCFYAMNSAYVIIDSFRCANGYVTDGHDFQILTNGHAFLMSYDIQVVDMSVIVPGGNPAAMVSGVVIQELDENKQLVFEWSSWDHFAITDATHEDLTAATIDYVHANALEVDADGNILLSARNMDEITKIDRSTGDIIWRLGGINNQFTFINDSIRFSHQHDIRRLPNGNITMFDNGNFHAPPFSRAVEYRLDEQRRTAELTWEFRNSPSIYAFATGNVQRLPNGNTLISWGTTNVITEVRPDGTKTLELILSPLFTVYRTFRFPWTSTDVNESKQLPTVAALLPAYPNPFNPSTAISFTIPRSTFAMLTIFNTLGQEIVTLISDQLNAGTYSTEWNATNVASGVYFCRLSTDNLVGTRKLLFLK